MRMMSSGRGLEETGPQSVWCSSQYRNHSFTEAVSIRAGSIDVK